MLGLNRAWGISDQFFLLGDSLILAVLGQVGTPPPTCPSRTSKRRGLSIPFHVETGLEALLYSAFCTALLYSSVCTAPLYSSADKTVLSAGF